MGKLETIVQGTEHTIRLTVLDDSTSVAIDVRAWDLFFTLKRNYTDTIALISKTNTDMDILGTGHNIIDIPLLYTETNLPLGRYYFDVKATNNSGTISLLPPQLLEIVYSVTDPTMY